LQFRTEALTGKTKLLYGTSIRCGFVGQLVVPKTEVSGAEEPFIERKYSEQKWLDDAVLFVYVPYQLT